MRAQPGLIAKRFFVQREERGVAVHSSFDVCAAEFTFSEVVTHSDQFRGAEPLEGKVLKLLLSQVFHSFIFEPPPRE